MATVKQLLHQANTLLGLSTPAAPPRRSSTSLAAVLRDRLAAYHALANPQKPQDDERDYPEEYYQRLTAFTALALLSRLASALSPSSSTSPSLGPPSPSTSSSAPPTRPQPSKPPTPPTFGARDLRALNQLAAVVAKWGVTALSARIAGGPAQQQRKGRFEEVDEEQERRRAEENAQAKGDLADVLRQLLRLLGLDKDSDSAAQKGNADLAQLRQLVSPHVVQPLVGGLVQFVAQQGEEAQGGHEGEEGWAREALERVLESLPAPLALSTLLSLLAPAPHRSPLRTHLASLLSSQLTRPGGVRALLIVVVGTGGGTGEDEVGGRKMEMVRRLVSARPGDGDDETYFPNLARQLLAILTQGAAASVSSFLHPSSSSSSSALANASAKGKAPASPGEGQAQAEKPVAPVPPPILRAATYVVAHWLVDASSSPSAPVSTIAKHARPVLLEALHGPLLPLSFPSRTTKEVPPRALYTHLTLLSLLLLYAPPLPTPSPSAPSLLSTLLCPLLAALLSLRAHLASPPLISSSSPTGERLTQGVKDEVEALLGAFARAEDVQTAAEGVGRAVERWEAGEAFGARRNGEEDEMEEGNEGRWEWTWDDAGAPCLAFSLSSRSPSPTPSSSGSEDLDPSALLPLPPSALVSWLKEVDRAELSAALLLRWLDEVRVLRGVEGVEGARRALLRLQLVLTLVDTLGSSILQRPAEVVAFVAHALEEAPKGLKRSSDDEPGEGREEEEGEREGRTGLEGLFNVGRGQNEREGKAAREEDKQEEEDDDEGVLGGEEAEELGLGTGLGKDEMAMTALTLLLAVLEANDTLDESNTPLLAVVRSQLSHLSTSSPSPLIGPLARQAGMVLSLRRASSSFASSSFSKGKDGEEDPYAQSRETYQSALRLLQDPLLPVRAQGLHLLRSLVVARPSSPSPSSSSSSSKPAPAPAPTFLSTDPALLPAVLDIFLRSLSDADSFLYLSAVQGLASLVDVHGRQVVVRLTEAYTGGGKTVGMGEQGRAEVDRRLRVGEALVQVVQRAGEALGVLSPALLPPLLHTLRASSLPTALRASALTILATCVEAAPAAMCAHAETLVEACTTLLSVESRAVAPPRARRAEGKGEKEKLEKGKEARKEKQDTKGKGVLIEEVSSSSSSSASSDSDSSDSEDAPLPLGKDGRPRRPEELADPTLTSSRHPTLRRAALVFLGALVRTVAGQVEAQREKAERAAWPSSGDGGAQGLLGGTLRLPGQPSVSTGGGWLIRERQRGGRGVDTLISAEELVRARRVLRYVSETDEDALVRHQAGEVLAELE
ncbi:hypothetical protein JCM10207_000836 [Rhodosporidiobolus poonsookiae]